MPAYNAEKFIDAAIRSVIAQSFADWELLIVNDGSTDATADIARRYAGNDVRITVFDKTNGGVSTARNYGLARAKGEYLHFMDSDDELLPDFYERLLSVFDRHADLDFVGGGYICRIYKKGVVKSSSSRADRGLSSSDILTRETALDLHLYFNTVWNKMFRMDFIKRNHLKFRDDLSRTEDSEFMGRILCLKPAPTFEMIPYCGYVYNYFDDMSLSKSIDNKTVGLFKLNLSLMRDYIVALGGDESLADAAVAHNGLNQYMFFVGSAYARPFTSRQRFGLLSAMRHDRDLKQLVRRSNPCGAVGKLFRLFVLHCPVRVAHPMLTVAAKTYRLVAS